MVKKDTLKRMIEVLEYLKKFISDYGYPPSVREIAKGMNIKSTATVYYYLMLLEEHKYIYRHESKNRAIEVIDTSKRNNIDIPLVGKIAAGEPILAYENVEGIFSLPMELFSSGELFMLNVAGNSMIKAGILDGDIIVVRKQPTAENGQIIAAMLEGDATVKRLYIKGGKYILHPENDVMQDIITESLDILGVVVGLIRKV